MSRGLSTRDALRLVLTLVFAACSGESNGRVFVAEARIAFPAAQGSTEWTLPARDYSNSRYSELADITSRNVRGLRVAWTFSTGPLRGHEGQPLVVGNTARAGSRLLRRGESRCVPRRRKLVYNLLDGHTVVVDVATGRQLWRTKMGDLDKGATITMAMPRWGV